MDLSDPEALLLLTAAWLGLGSRRLRLLASGHDVLLREWVADDAVPFLRQARRYARGAAHRLQSMGAKMVTLGESAYPAGLRELADPPAFLTYRGRIDVEGITIVGTRTPTRRAAELAYNVAARLGRPTISGLALGIDAAVHRGSLSAYLPTLAYVGSGIAQVYPAEHRGLQEEIIACGGGVASEHLPEKEASHASLVRRDRLQAAHGAATLLIASDASGGAMHTMRFAQSLRKARFALEPSGEGEGGNRRAIQNGAIPLAKRVDDIVLQLRRALEN